MKVYEKIIEYEWQSYTIRVWQHLDKLSDRDNNSIADFIRTIINKARSDYTTSGDLLETIANVPGVNAVEMKNKEGYGVLIYPDWP